MLQFQPMKLLVTQKEAADLLSMCERKFWEEVNQGKIPKIKLGRSVRYDVRDLLAYVDHLKEAPPSE